MSAGRDSGRSSISCVVGVGASLDDSVLWWSDVEDLSCSGRTKVGSENDDAAPAEPGGDCMEIAPVRSIRDERKSIRPREA